MAKKLNDATFLYGGVKMTFSKSKTAAAVKYTTNGTPTARSARSARSTGEPIDDFHLVRAKTGIDKKLDRLRSQHNISAGTHVWNVDGDDNIPFIPTGKLYIEFVADSDAHAQHDLMEKYHLSIQEEVFLGAYRVAVTDRSPNPVKCAIALQKSKLIRVAEPEFLTLPAERDFIPPAGKYISSQWHFENNGQAIPVIDIDNAVYGADHFKKGADAKVKAAWNFLGNTGSRTLKIAVIDTGFAIDHPQLRGDGTKIKSPFNAANRTGDVSAIVTYSDGSVGVFSHGTSCAAVAAGALDSQGVLGAAPNSRIIPIKLDILSDDAIKNAFEHALVNGADIISCSLGFPKPVPLSTYAFNAVRKAAREGRGGKGIPIFIAAGNANPSSDNEPREISDFGAHPDVICVTASNSLDERSDYSFYGAPAWLCAPTNGNEGVGITTATVELDGNEHVVLGYTSGFGGTSSAAPLSAGCCALLLSANPALTLTQIKDILKSTCDKIGAKSAYNTGGHSDFFGYGRINAFQAVKKADELAQGGTPPTPTPTPVPTPVSVQRAKVVSKFLNVRSGPSTSFAKVGQLAQGDIVNLLEKTNNWYRIGDKRYVSADYLQIIPLQKKGKVISATLNVRSGPSTAFGKIAVLKLGDKVDIYETSPEGWHRIGDGKWVIGKYIQIV